MQTTLIFYRSDYEAAEKTADAVRKEGRRGQVRCIRRFDGTAETADAVRLAECLTQGDIARLRAVYGEKVAEPTYSDVPYPEAYVGNVVFAGASENVVHIPDDWRKLKWFAKRTLAMQISGVLPKDAEEAHALIEPEAKRQGKD